MIHIVSSTDKNYVMPTGVMMTSVCENHRNEEITFHLLIDGSVTVRQKKELNSLLRNYENKCILFYLIDDNFFEIYPKIGEYFPHITKATYYRLRMGDILPQNVSKILYLDSDIIVNQKLTQLWDTDISNHPIACIPDMFNDKERYNRLGYPALLGYFNAGVLIVNLRYWREHDMTHVFMDFMKQHSEKIKFHDQDVMNYVFRETKLTLPLKFNSQNGFFFKKEHIGIDTDKYFDQLEEAVSNPVIVHFTLSQKPWIIGCQHPYTKVWQKYRDMTPWRHRNILDTLKYSGLRHTVGYYTRKWGLKAPMENPYITLPPSK